MAQLNRHASLRFSVFDVAFNVGLESRQLDGNFTPILEGDESEDAPPPSKQRQTHSSDEFTDSPYPLTPPESATVRTPKVCGIDDKELKPPSLHIQSIAKGPFAKRPEDHPRFIERFATPTPETVISASNPSTPKPSKPALGKLRKVHTSPVEVDLTQDKDNDRDFRRRDTKAKREEEKQSAKARSKSKDASREKHQFPTTSPDEEEKKGISGLLRFRTKSKERKAAAKQAIQIVTEEQMPRPRPHTPPPLPIAGKFYRQTDDVSFRPTLRESGSSHADSSSVGHISNNSIGDSSETHESYPKARNRSSRYERPHPAWRTVPSGLGVGKLRKTASPVEEEKKEVPEEFHAYPPGQTIFDREPVWAPTRPETPKQPEPPQIDMDAVNKYYGFTDAEPVSTQPSTPLPSNRMALVDALSPVETKKMEQLNPGRSTPVPPQPVSPSPFIVPSPNPTQNEFGAQARTKRSGGSFAIPPPINSGLTPPRRATGAHNPPPTPPPTTELPPIPNQPPHMAPTSSLQVSIPDQQNFLSPYPPSAHRSPSPLSPLGSRSSSPNLRSISPSQPSPITGQRPGTAPQQGGPPPPSPMRQGAVTPIQRGKVSPFPARPITPTNRPITPTNRPITPSIQTVVAPAAPSGNHSPITGNNYLLNRRPDFDPTGAVRPKANMNEGNIFVRPNRGPQHLRFTESTIFHTRPSTEEDHYLVEASSPPAPRRNRSIRKSRYRSGYDSDDAESRYSRDTYYGRETAYFDDTNVPDIPSMSRGSSEAPPMPRRNISDAEDERKMGRERLLRMLETQNQNQGRPRYI